MLNRKNRAKIVAFIAAFFAYLILFLAFVYLKIPGAAMCAVIPVAALAFFCGWRVGLAAGVVSLPVTIVLYEAAGVDWYQRMIQRGALLEGTLAICVFAFVLGRMSELSRRLKNELAAKQAIEDELRLHRDNLAQLVDSKTREVQESQARFRAIAENSPDAIIITDAPGVILYSNKSAGMLFGYDRRELQGKPFTRLIPQRLRAAELARAEQFVQPGGASAVNATIESTMLRKDGTEFPVEFSLYSWNMDREWFFATIIRDITERRQAADELEHAYEDLRRSRDFFQNVFNAAGDAIYVTDELGRIEFANRALYDMLGYEPGELTGIYAAEITADIPGIGSGPGIEHTMYQRDYSEPFDTFFLRKDGTSVPVESRIANVQEGAEGGAGLIFALRDITLRKQAEEEIRRARDYFESILKASPDAVFVSDADGMIVMANESVLDVYGYRPEELIGKHVTVLAIDDKQSMRESSAMIEELYASGVVRNFVCKRRRRDGAVIQIEASHALLKNPDGSVAGSVSSTRDITQRKQFEEHARQSQKMEAIGTLAGGIAHDFNNILAAIIGYSELSKDMAAGNVQIERNLDQVLQAADRAKSLVKQILTFSRKTEPERKPLMPHLVIKEALKLMRATVPATVEIQTDIPELPDVITGDATEVHQVVMNLCTNSVHAMEERGGVLGVRLDTIDISPALSAVFNDIAPGRYVRLCVRDTGCGISPDIKSRIFDPFFTTKAQHKGTGMGLAVVHGIVKSYGGEITVDSTPGRDTVFTVLLPSFSAYKEPDEAETHAALVRGSERILLVDDEGTIIACMQAQLSSLGYRVTAVQDPQAAFDAFEKDPDGFDLIITDQAMPCMTGEELARSILAVKPHMPIILCTGFSEKIDEASSRALGVRGFVMKPAGIREMADAIRAALDTSV